MAVGNEQTARTRALKTDLPALVSYLSEQLGERLTAAIAGATDESAIRTWMAGQARPEPASERTLRTAYEVTRMLLEVDSVETVRLWFRGMNTELDDKAPALMIAKDPARVLSAARFFVAHG